MGDLTNQQIDQTYDGLIHTATDEPIDGTLVNLQDGVGNNLPIQVSNTTVNFTGTVTGITTTDTTYDLGAVGAAGNINVALSGSDGSNDVVTVQAGSNITLTDNGSNTFTIDAAGGSAALEATANGTFVSTIGTTPASVGTTLTSIAIGNNTVLTGGQRGVAIGHDININAEGSVVIGTGASNGDIYGTAVGEGAFGGYFGVALGNGASGSFFGTALGADTRTEADYGIAIGGGQSRAQSCITIGANSLVDDGVRVNTVVIGADGASQTKAAQYSTAVGSQSIAVGAEATALGYRAAANFNGSVALGANVQAVADNTASVNRLHIVDISTNYPDDGSAAAAGIPVGGVYHTDGILKIRLA